MKPCDIAAFGKDLDEVRLIFDGDRYVDIRVFEEVEGVWKAGAEGLTLRLDQLHLLREALGRAERRLAAKIAAEEARI